ncbi:pterin-4-alpha-carbinolamine dehydratase 2 [Rozella allomycis CSF55]|uniref:4a-hydroxytetrahydrobiopterin dehydratase n=1 Tax=Rozella allomycis (strain CSF55) TaxID=988480 RepID=A0A4P9YJ79_ROZAC|nr:pterin-4-alpha-carbinolamine dehydratase 2 [Rozella allomycis CSF55]
MQKDEIAKLVSLGWKQLSNDKKLQKEFVFKNFVHAFKFMTLIAEKAEQVNHHPEWFNVDIVWTTHDAQQLTEKDITMAQLCDKLHAETVNSIN